MAATASVPAYMLPGVSVHQPAHLEGDPALATEILPGPPPLVAVQQAAQKRDSKKPAIHYSYLPPSDPGSTYSGIMHGTLVGQDQGPLNKRSRTDKGTATGRAQRASARNQGAAASSLPPITPIDAGPSSLALHDSDSAGGMPDDDPHAATRSDSATVEPAKPRRRDKGKRKESDNSSLRVKEEPKASSLLSPEPSSNLLSNEDHCSACRSFGSLVYCDGCPRAFHFWCLDPPLESVDEGNAQWFCPACVARKHPPPKPPSSLLSCLIHQIQTSNPVEFQLPDDIKFFFKDVASGNKGNYVDATTVKTLRPNRLGQAEDRDPHRLRDRNGDPVLCFRCGNSALPSNLSAPPSKRPRRAASKAASPETWKNILSCDYCNLHWHLDCLDPPLSALPPVHKKWMCPNHVERVLPPKRRIPRHNVAPIEVTKPRQFNSGNIEIIPSDINPAPPSRRPPVDEVLINGRRYRVPERVIILDFWNRLNHRTEIEEPDLLSALSSPLSSLSSLDDEEQSTTSSQDVTDDMTAAQWLCGLASAKKFDGGQTRSGLNGGSRRLIERGMQTDSTPPIFTATARTKAGTGRKSQYVVPAPVETTTNGTSRAANGRDGDPSYNVTISTVRRRKAPNPVQTEGRELRSRSKNNVPDTPVSSRSSARNADEGSRDSPLSEPVTTPLATQARGKNKDVYVKLEEVDNSEMLLDPTPSTSTAPKRYARAPRQTRQKDSEPARKEGKGRKRKQCDDEPPSVPHQSPTENEPRGTVKKSKSESTTTKKGTKTPSKPQPSSATSGDSATTSLSSISGGSTSLPAPPTTPSSLIIRIPSRVNVNGNGHNVLNGTHESPNRR